MKFLFLFVLILLPILPLQAQKSLENSLTKAHKHIAGTKVSIVQPKEFSKAQNFLGFQHEKSTASIMVIELAAGFAEVSGAFTKEALLSQGVSVKQSETVTVNALPGFFITGQQRAYGNSFSKYILTFGTDKESVIISGVFPEDSVNVGLAIKSAVLSAFYEPEKVLNPYEGIDFGVNVAKSGLIVGKGLSGHLVFTKDGLFPTKSEDKTNFIVGKSSAPIGLNDKKEFCVQRIKQMPMDVTRIISTKPVKIDGMSGFEILADAKDKESGLVEKVYQVILFRDLSYYIMVGSTNRDSEQNIRLFKSIARSFKRKGSS